MRKKFEGRTVFEAMRGAQSTAGTCRSIKFIVGRMDDCGEQRNTIDSVYGCAMRCDAVRTDNFCRVVVEREIESVASVILSQTKMRSGQRL